MSVEGISGADGATAAGGAWAGLAGFVAKAGYGDIASECQALFSNDAALQFRSGRSGVLVNQRRIAEARRRSYEALQRYEQAIRKKSFWSRLAGTFGKVFGALSAALGLLGGPAGLAGAVAATGVLGAGGMKIASAAFGVSAAKAQAKKMIQEKAADHARSETQDWRQMLEQAAQFESDMVKHVRRVCEEETGARLG